MKKVLLAFSLASLIGAGTVSNAHALWGCSAQTPQGAWGYSFAEPTRASAQKKALAGCAVERGAGEAPCHIVVCNPNVDTEDQAEAKLPH
jgi:hypothetical protein